LYAIGMEGAPDGEADTDPMVGARSVFSLNLTYGKGKRLPEDL
jgi:hypothetical protein